MNSDEEFWKLSHGMSQLPWDMAYERMTELAQHFSEVESFYWSLFGDWHSTLGQMSAFITDTYHAVTYIVPFLSGGAFIWPKLPTDDSAPLQEEATASRWPDHVDSSVFAYPWLDLAIIPEHGAIERELADLATYVAQHNPSNANSRSDFELWIKAVDTYVKTMPWIGTMIDPHKDETFFILFVRNGLIIPPTDTDEDQLSLMPFARIRSAGSNVMFERNRNFAIY